MVLILALRAFLQTLSLSTKADISKFPLKLDTHLSATLWTSHCKIRLFLAYLLFGKVTDEAGKTEEEAVVEEEGIDCDRIYQ